MRVVNIPKGDQEALRAAPASIPPCRSEMKEMCHTVVEILQGILNFHKISSKKHVVDTLH